MSCFKGISLLSRCDVLALTDALSLALTDGLNVNDLNTLGNLLMTVGSFMTTFGALNAAPDNASSQPSDADKD